MDYILVVIRKYNPAIKAEMAANPLIYLWAFIFLKVCLKEA
jgi:hypothetical protein